MSIDRACELHQIAMHDGLWLLPDAKVKPAPGDPPLSLGLHISRHPSRRLMSVYADVDGTNTALCQALVRQRADDGTWGFATLVEGSAMPPSPLDAWLLAEFTAAIVQQRGPRGPMAIVAPTEAQFQIAKAYQSCSATPTPVPFRTRHDAIGWLAAQGF
jgi:hypothetical protein